MQQQQPEKELIRKFLIEKPSMEDVEILSEYIQNILNIADNDEHIDAMARCGNWLRLAQHIPLAFIIDPKVIADE